MTRVWSLRILVAALALLVVYLTFEFGRIQAGHNILDAAAERRDSGQQIAGLEAEIRTLREEVALLEMQRTIEAEAYSEVEMSLVDLQAKIQEQRDAIAFYRGIVSPSDGGAGLRVQDL